MGNKANTNLLAKAIIFASKAHAGQLRPNGEPYIGHPIEVMHTLQLVGGIRDTDTLIAAVLHDVVEDCGVKAEEIEEQFGPNVRSIVLEVTDDMSKSKEERNRLQIENAASKSDQAKLVKLADKTNNVGGCVTADWTVEKRNAYINQAVKVVNAGLRGVNSALDSNFDKAVAEARALINGKPE